MNWVAKQIDVLPSLSILISVFVNFSNSHGQRRMALGQDGDTSPERRVKRNATHVEVFEAEETGRWFWFVTTIFLQNDHLGMHTLSEELSHRLCRRLAEHHDGLLPMQTLPRYWGGQRLPSVRRGGGTCAPKTEFCSPQKNRFRKCRVQIVIFISTPAYVWNLMFLKNVINTTHLKKNTTQ